MNTPHSKKQRSVAGPSPAAAAVPLPAAGVGPIAGMADGLASARERRPAAGKPAPGRRRVVVMLPTLFILFYRFLFTVLLHCSVIGLSFDDHLRCRFRYGISMSSVTLAYALNKL